MNSNTRLTQTFIGAMVLAATISAIYAGARSPYSTASTLWPCLGWRRQRPV